MLLVSIIIPSYNAGKFISKTMGSIVGQTYKNWECILIDDGSTDNTKEIIEGFRFQYPDKIFYHRQLNQGSCAARNKGLEYAGGEFIYFLDADDYLAANTLELLCKEIKDCDFVYCNAVFVDDDGKVLKRHRYNHYQPDPFISFLNKAPYCGTAMIRKNRINTLWDHQYDQIDEFCFFTELTLDDLKVRQINADLFYYRQHSSDFRKSNTIGDWFTDAVMAYLDFYDKLKARGKLTSERKSYLTYLFIDIIYTTQKGRLVLPSETISRLKSRVSILSCVAGLFHFRLIRFIGGFSLAAKKCLKALFIRFG